MKLFVMTILSVWLSLECFALQSGWIIKDTTVTKSSEGKTIALFDIQLSANTPEELNVSFATQDGSAKEGKDYVKTNGIFTLLPGQNSGKIVVDILDNRIKSTKEKEFYIQLTSKRVPLFKGRAKCTILDNGMKTTHQETVSNAPKGAKNVIR